MSPNNQSINKELQLELLHIIVSESSPVKAREKSYDILTSPDLNKETLDLLVKNKHSLGLDFHTITREINPQVAEQFLQDKTSYEWLVENPYIDQKLVHNYVTNGVFDPNQVMFFLTSLNLPANVRLAIYDNHKNTTNDILL